MSEQIKTKTCNICKQLKPISEFYKGGGCKDGHQYKCKTCQKQYLQRYFKTDKGKASQKRHMQKETFIAAKKRYEKSEKGRVVKNRYEQSEKGRETQKRYNIRHPEHEKARRAVNSAIKSGTLSHLDSLQCSCGKPAKHYHHHKGYAPEHWLDVVPVCIKCH